MLKNSPLGYDFGKFFSFVCGLEKILENYAGGSGSLREAPGLTALKTVANQYCRNKYVVFIKLFSYHARASGKHFGFIPWPLDDHRGKNRNS